MGWAGLGWEWLVISSCNDMVPWICKQVAIVISVWYLNGNDGMIGNVFVVNFNHFETHDTLYHYIYIYIMGNGPLLTTVGSVQKMVYTSNDPTWMFELENQVAKCRMKQNWGALFSDKPGLDDGNFWRILETSRLKWLRRKSTYFVFWHFAKLA